MGRAAPTRWSFNGSDAAENINISANGNHVRFTRDVGGVAMDLAGVETINFSALGGADVINVDDQTATDLSTVNLDLTGTVGPSATARPTPSSSTAPTAPTPSRCSPPTTDRASPSRACFPW